jgi:dipeptidyl aminopeptidase/acylaminoacyl peptidase
MSCLDVGCIKEVLDRTAPMSTPYESNLGVSLSRHLLVFVERTQIWPVPKSQIFTSAIDVAAAPKLLAVGDGPTISPNGQFVAFWSDIEEGRQLWLADLDTRTTRRVTHVPGGLAWPSPAADDMQGLSGANRIAWSPRGDRVVVSVGRDKDPVAPVAREPWLANSGATSNPPSMFSSRDPQADAWKALFRSQWRQAPYWNAGNERDELVEIDLKSGDVKPLFQAALSYVEPAWAADGRHIIAIERDPSATPSWETVQHLALIDVRSRAITHEPVSGWLSQPAFSEDGTRISVVRRDPTLLGFPHLKVLELKTQQITQIAASGVAERNGAKWDGNRLFYLQRRGLRDEIWRSSAPQPLTGDLQATIADYQVADGRVFAIIRTLTSPLTIGEIRQGRMRPYYERPSTQRPEEQPDYRTLQWRSADGTQIDGMLLLPRERHGAPPVILNPYPSLARYTYYGGMEGVGTALLLKNGYAVFFLNARTPHSVMSFVGDEALAKTAIGPAGLDRMVADIASGIDTLRQMGTIDADRIFGFGHSNGAMTLVDLIPRYHELKCAVIHNPALFGQESYFATSEPARHAAWYGGPQFWDDPAFYEPFDPLTHIKGFETPVFLIAGSEDWAVEQSLFFNGMRSAGKAISLAVYMGDGHVPSQENWPDYWWRVLNYFAHC